MLKTLFRLVVRLAIIASLAYAARRALRQWVDGPDPEPARTPWTPVAAPPAPSAAAPSATTTPAVTTTPAATAPVAPADPINSAPAAATAPQPVGSAGPEPVEATAPQPVEATGPEPAEVTEPQPAEPQPAEPQPAEPQAPAAGAAWVEAGPDGSAPESHPVKVKLSSRLYRLPGSASYDRTKADRCYASAEAAEADGFTRAKR